MTSDGDDIATGSVFASGLGLLLAIAVPLLCVTVPLSVIGVWAWAAPVAALLAGLVVAPWLRRTSTISVTDEGVTLLRAGRLGFVPWSNVRALTDGWFPALELEEPQLLAWREADRLRYAAFDPAWRTRPTTMAITREFARSRPPAG